MSLEYENKSFFVTAIFQDVTHIVYQQLLLNDQYHHEELNTYNDIEVLDFLPKIVPTSLIELATSRAESVTILLVPH